MFWRVTRHSVDAGGALALSAVGSWRRAQSLPPRLPVPLPFFLEVPERSRGVTQTVVYPCWQGFCGCRSRWLCLDDVLNFHREARRKKERKSSLGVNFSTKQETPQRCVPLQVRGSSRNKTGSRPDNTTSFPYWLFYSKGLTCLDYLQYFFKNTMFTCYWPVLFVEGPPQAYFAHWQLIVCTEW